MDKASYLCQHCGECCKCVVLPVQRPIQKSLFFDWLHARGGKVVAESPGTLYVKIDSICPHLQKSGSKVLCDDYESRPPGCRIFKGAHLDWLNCAWKDPYLYVVGKSLRDIDLIKRGSHSVGFGMKRSGRHKAATVRLRGKVSSSDQKKRLARRRTLRIKEEKAADIQAYGRSLEEEPKW